MTYLPKSELVGVLQPYSINRQDIGTNWQNLGDITATINVTISYLGNGITIVGDAVGHIWRSVDYGASWFDVAAPGSLIASSSYLGNGIVIVGDANGNVFRSTDFGATWAGVAGNPIGFTGLNTSTYLGNGIAIFGSVTPAIRIFRSTDFGVTWAILAVIIGSTTFTSSSYLGNGIAIVGDVGGSIWRSIDFGATWAGVAGNPISGSYIGTLSYLDNGIIVAGDGVGNVFRSNNFGITWTGVTGNPISGGGILASSYLGNGIALFGDNTGHLFRSEDTGLRWTDLGPISGGVVPGIRSISYLDNGVTIFSNDSGRIYRSDVAYKKNEAQANFERIFIDQTASRNLNATYTNSDQTRSLMIFVECNCGTGATPASEALFTAKADTATPPVTLISAPIGLNLGLASESNNFMLVAVVPPGNNYRVDTTTSGSGSVVKIKWFEMYI